MGHRVLSTFLHAESLNCSKRDIEHGAQSGPTKAGLLLFNDLCALAAGQGAPWLQVSLPNWFTSLEEDRPVVWCGHEMLQRFKHSCEQKPRRSIGFAFLDIWCAYTRGLQVPALPRAFALDMLEFVLSQHAEVTLRSLHYPHSMRDPALHTQSGSSTLGFFG